MNNLILLVIGAAWAAVLLPPLLRSRMEARPGMSISSFRRQLGSLQRTMPGGSIQMRQMARPLAGQAGVRTHGAPRRNMTGTALDRRPAEYRSTAADPRQMRQRQQAAMARASVKQRRQNILFMLAGTAGVTGLLSAMTSASTVRYAFVLSLCLLVGYVYLLVQSRRVDAVRAAPGRPYWD